MSPILTPAESSAPSPGQNNGQIDRSETSHPVEQQVKADTGRHADEEAGDFLDKMRARVRLLEQEAERAREEEEALSALAAYRQSRGASPAGSSSSSGATAVGSPHGSPLKASIIRDTKETYHRAGLEVTPCSTIPPHPAPYDQSLLRGFRPDSEPTQKIFAHFHQEGIKNTYARDSPQWALNDAPPRPIAADGRTMYYPIELDREFAKRGMRTEAVGRSDVEGFQLPLQDGVRAVFQTILEAGGPSTNSLSKDAQDTSNTAVQHPLANMETVDYTVWDEDFPLRVPDLGDDGTPYSVPDVEYSDDLDSPALDKQWAEACQRDLMQRRRGLILNQRVIRLMLYMAETRDRRDKPFYRGLPTSVLSKQAEDVIRRSQAHVKPYDEVDVSHNRQMRAQQRNLDEHKRQTEHVIAETARIKASNAALAKQLADLREARNLFWSSMPSDAPFTSPNPSIASHESFWKT